jgi:chemotaxis protein CheX
MDAKIINPFINATMNVIETMAFVKSKPDKPYLKKDNTAKGDVTGVIGVTGEANGTVSITFEEASILQIVSSMFSEEITELNFEVADAVGELTNMVSGQARSKLEEIGKIFHSATPTVITGKNHMVVHITDGPKIAVPFSTDAGGFTMEICLDS